MLIVFEDAHLLVINKPAGINTHAPGPFAGEGIYDWFRHREPRWATLSIIHRLDKETSGLMVFGKTPLANRSLTDQFASRAVHKSYIFATDRPLPKAPFTARSALVRSGEKYLSRPIHAGAELAETRFAPLRSENGLSMIEAIPLTGRTHQIRVHAAAHELPIFGDVLYGGSPADRLWLHAQELRFTHPETGELLHFTAEAEFTADSRLKLREAIIDPSQTNAYRLIHGASDRWPGWYVDRLGDFLLSQSETALQRNQQEHLETLLSATKCKAAYHKKLLLQPGEKSQASPELVLGDAASAVFPILENGVHYELSFDEGYSVGLFLDQRDNRRRILTNHIAADFPLFDGPLQGREVLNTFAYTCGLSVCAALAGARATSLDLSRKYLDWGKRNFALNGLDAAKHDFIYGDVFDWLRRLAKKNRTFDLLLLDPPTFSQSKASGVFRAEKDYGRLVQLALPLLRPNGTLFASTNAAKWPPEQFIAAIESAIAKSKRPILQRHYFPQPPDFPITRAEPAYLKTLWLRLG